MRELVTGKALRWTWALGVLLPLGLCLSPLIGRPGIESALVLALLLSPLAAAAAARWSHRLRLGPVENPRVIVDGVNIAILLLLPSLVLLPLNSLRFQSCDPGTGALFLLAGPLPSVLLSTTVGTLIGLSPLRARWATLTSVSIVLATFGLALARFYSTPAIYAYGHFFGYFPGTLYDPDITLRGPYFTLRGLTFLLILGLVGLIALLFDSKTGRLSLSAARARIHLTVATLICLGLVLTGEVYGTELGHRSDADSIAQALGGRVETEHCVAIVPREMPRREAQLLAADCDFRVGQAARILGVSPGAPLMAYFFRSSEEKRALMGAARTYIAKPWRNEVYLQRLQWPHPVLLHEVTHVVAGQVGRGPFRISGRLGGLLPSPVLIEGLAVAVAWQPRDGLTPHQWARAMVDIGLAPPLSDLQGLSFLLQPASQAYTLSGSFIRWVLDTQGVAEVRRLYREGQLDGGSGTLESQERQWRLFLQEEVELPESALELARMRFERPGLFAQICPHRIANLRRGLESALLGGDDELAAQTCEQILSLDPGQTTTRSMLVASLARQGLETEAREHLDILRGPPRAATPVYQAAREGLADALWQHSQPRQAREIYEALLNESAGEVAARQIEVRLLALDAGGAEEGSLREFLLPRRDLLNDGVSAMRHLITLDRARPDGLAPYLMARLLAARQRHDLALPLLRQAERRGLATRRLTREARAMRGRALYATGQGEESAQVWRQVYRAGDATEADRVVARDWLSRIAHSEVPSTDAPETPR